MSEANNITFAQAKTSFFYRPKVKRKYNTLHLAGKEVCKKDEERAGSHKDVAILLVGTGVLDGPLSHGCIAEDKYEPRQIVNVCRGSIIYSIMSKENVWCCLDILYTSIHLL